MKKCIVFALTLCLLAGSLCAGVPAAAQPQPEFLAYGDPDENGRVDAADALLTLQFSVGKCTLTDRQKDRATVSGDESIDAADALQMLQVAVGKRKCFTANAPLYGQNLVLKTAQPEKYQQPVWQDHLNAIEKRYGMTVTVEPVDATQEQSGVFPEETAHLVELSVSQVLDHAKQGLVANLKQQSLQQSTLTTPATRAATVRNWVCGVGGVSAGGFVGIFYNQDLLQKYAPDYDLQALYEAGEWDFDTLREVARLCTRDTNGDNKKDICGLVDDGRVVEMSIAANDGTYIRLEQEKPQLAISSTSMAFASTLFMQDRVWNYFASREDTLLDFADGRSAMLVGDLSDLPLATKDAGFDWGFIPMAKIPDRDGYVQPFYDSSVYAVSALKGENEAAVVLLHELLALEPALRSQCRQDLLSQGFSQQEADTILTQAAAAQPQNRYGLSEVTQKTIISQITNPVLTPNYNKYLLKRAQTEAEEYFQFFYQSQ